MFWNILITTQSPNTLELNWVSENTDDQLEYWPKNVILCSSINVQKDGLHSPYAKYLTPQYSKVSRSPTRSFLRTPRIWWLMTSKSSYRIKSPLQQYRTTVTLCKSYCLLRTFSIYTLRTWFLANVHWTQLLIIKTQISTLYTWHSFYFGKF